MSTEKEIIAAAKALCEKFIDKVESGRVKNVETYTECKSLLELIYKHEQVYCHECSALGNADMPIYHAPPACK